MTRGPLRQFPGNAGDPGRATSVRGEVLRHLVWATPLMVPLALLPGGRLLLPFAVPLTVYPAFARRVRQGDHFGAWRLGLLWAALLSAAVIVFVLFRPEAAWSGILHGEPYRHEMFGWIATGQAPENDWRQFVPQHLLHLVIFLVLTWVSGGYLGLVLGAALVGYMSYFVGSYAAAVSNPWLGALAAWVPWSVVRVLAFVLLGSLFARPLLVRRPWPFNSQEYRLMLLAASGLAADVAIKALLAPGYGLFLRQMARSAMLALYSAAPLTAGGGPFPH